MTFEPTKDSAEQLLQALAVGDLDPQDSRVIARFAAQPELAIRWEQLAATLAVLHDLDDRPEPTSGPAPEVRRLDTMAAIQKFRRESPRRARHWRLVIPGAALVAAALTLVWWLLPPPVPPVDPLLGGTVITLTPPDGAPWPAGSPLRWTLVPRAENYRLQLRGLPDGPALSIPGETFGLASLLTNEWLPSADQRLKLPTEFEWRVIAFHGDRELATSGWAKTSR